MATTVSPVKGNTPPRTSVLVQNTSNVPRASAGQVGNKDTAFSRELHPVPPLHLDPTEITPQNLQTQVMAAYETLRRATLPMRQNPASAPSHSRGLQVNASPASPQFLLVPHGLGRPHTGSHVSRHLGTQFAGAETVTGAVSHVTMGSGGTGYTTPPLVQFSPAGPTAEAVLANGSVSYVRMLSAGQNLSSTPTVTFSGGGGTGATAGASLPPDYDPTRFAQYTTTSSGTYDFQLWGD